METLGRGGDDDDNAAGGGKAAAVRGGTGPKDAADPPSTQSSIAVGHGASRASPLPAAAGSGTGPKDHANPPSPQFPRAIGHVSSSSSPLFAAMGCGASSFAVLPPPPQRQISAAFRSKPDERSSSGPPAREQPDDLKRSMAEFEDVMKKEQEDLRVCVDQLSADREKFETDIKKEREGLLLMKDQLKHQHDSFELWLKKEKEGLQNRRLQLQIELSTGRVNLTKKQQELDALVQELKKLDENLYEREEELRDQLRKLHIKRFNILDIEAAIEETKLKDLEENLSRREEEARRHYKQQKNKIAHQSIQLRQDVLNEFLLQKEHLKKLTSKDDDICSWRQILLLFALLCGLTLLFSTYVMISQEYLNVVVGLFAMIWFLWYASLPFGMFGTKKHERNFSRQATYIIYLFFSISASYTFYIITIPRPVGGEPPAPPRTSSVPTFNWICLWLSTLAILTVSAIILPWCRGCWTEDDQDACDRT